MLNATPRVDLPSVTLKGGAADVHGLSLLMLGAIVGIVATAAVVYLCQPKTPTSEYQ